MAKPRPCPNCGAWYKPKFGGDEFQCFGCIIREKMKEQDTPTKR